jgi:hypothetical protein
VGKEKQKNKRDKTDEQVGRNRAARRLRGVMAITARKAAAMEAELGGAVAIERAAVRIEPEAVTGRQGERGDYELVRFVARHGAVGIEHVMAALGIGQAWAYRRVGRCIELGLLKRSRVIHAERSLICATRSGQRYVGLGGFPVAEVRPHAVDHVLRCASTARLLAREFSAEQILTERELQFLEQGERRPLASAKIGTLPSGLPRLHRPDLVILQPGSELVSASSRGTASPSSSRTQGGGRVSALQVRDRDPRTEDTEMRSATSFNRPIAVEVELSCKGQRRLEQIIRGWRRADHIGEVRYYCAPGLVTRRLDRVVRKLNAGDRVRVLEVVAR